MPNPGMRIVSQIDRSAQEYVEKFKMAPVANVSDVMNRLFAMNSRIRPIGKRKFICGLAITVKAAIADNMMFHKAITMAQPGDVIVVNACEDTAHSVCGDVMYRLAQSRGVAGFVVDGSVRDTDFLAESDFPVYAAGVTARGPYKNGPGEINTDIACGGQVVHPGDLIIGDPDGLVVVRREDAPIVYEKYMKIRENESRLSGIIERGTWMEESPIIRTVNQKLEEQGYEIIG